MAENENLASILVKSGLISIFTNSPIGYFSKFANELAPPDVPLSVCYESKGSKHLKGKAMMLSSDKNKQHESMMFHRGRKGGCIPSH